MAVIKQILKYIYTKISDISGGQTLYKHFMYMYYWERMICYALYDNDSGIKLLLCTFK